MESKMKSKSTTASDNQVSNKKGNHKGTLGVFALAGILISGMIGSGVYSFPQNFAQYSGLDGVAWAWAITGVGMFFVANAFRILANVVPDATTGIYKYSKLAAGSKAGNYIGFTVAWGYWLCNVFGNVGLAVLFMDALDYFIPGVFTGGNTIPAIIGASIITWLLCIFVLSGLKQAAAVNLIGTIVKIVPLIIFIVAVLFVFKWDTFFSNPTAQEVTHYAGKAVKPLGSVYSQFKGCMMVTLWAFLGVEGAVDISSRAKSQKAVGQATIWGYLGTLLIYVILALVTFGYMTRPEMAALKDPSTAYVLESIVGKWGAILINGGLLISILIGWLAFTLMNTMIPVACAEDKILPQFFTKLNKKGEPTWSLIVMSIITQITLIFTYFASNAWNTMLNVTTVMVLPAYIGTVIYLWKISSKKENYPEKASTKRGVSLTFGILGTIYGIWMIWAAGPGLVLMSFIVLAIGIPLYIWARKDAQKIAKPGEVVKIFTKVEWIIMIVIIALAILGIVLGAMGIVNLS